MRSDRVTRRVAFHRVASWHQSRAWTPIHGTGCGPRFLAGALKGNGFLYRGRTPFYLRDPQHLVPRDRLFHLTHLEADLAHA